MIQSRIWLLWKRGNSTAAISRKLNVPEALAYKAVNDGMDAVYCNLEHMPWNRSAA